MGDVNKKNVYFHPKKRMRYPNLVAKSDQAGKFTEFLLARGQNVEKDTRD